jgi:hypothetical protein
LRGTGRARRAEDACFGLTFGEALAGEPEPGGTQEREEEPDGRGQDSRSFLQLLYGGQELLTVVAESFEGDDGARAAAFPARDSRARDVQFAAQRTCAGAAHMLSETVVVRAAVLRDRAKCWRHRGRMPERVPRARDRIPESSMISIMAQLRSRLFGMSWRVAGRICAGGAKSGLIDVNYFCRQM